MSITKISHDAVAAGAGRRPGDARSPAATVRKVDNTIAFRAKIDGFCIEKRRLEPSLN
jgi:hypothetical protein